MSAQELFDRLAALKDKVTEEALDDNGRHFTDGNYCDLTQCHHGDTGNYRNREDGQALALLWNLWKAGALDALIEAETRPSDEPTIEIDGRSYRKFIRYPAEVDDGTLRCISCGQIDEDEFHDHALCVAAATPSPADHSLGIIARFERAYPELYWHVAKGSLSVDEPIYGATINTRGGSEISGGESNVSIEDAFEMAFINSGLVWPDAPSRAPNVSWNDPATAAKDGTMLHLLIRPGQQDLDAFTSFHDSREPYETIGFNQMKDTLEDVWQFAGWDWCHDCITEGHGEVIGWLPFGSNSPLHAPNVELPQDTINLVIAAREAFDTGHLPDDESRALDKALEPFASKVRYANEPDDDAAASEGE